MSYNQLMKTCSECKLSLEVSNFSKNASRKDGMQNACKECTNTRRRNDYASNSTLFRKRVAESTKIRRSNNRIKVTQLKDNPCTDCQKRFIPFAMDFDHVSGIKIGDVGVMVAHGYKWSTIQLEIDKCELVCATCHRVRTWNRMQDATLR
jgi:hypothetical protein